MARRRSWKGNVRTQRRLEIQQTRIEIFASGVAQFSLSSSPSWRVNHTPAWWSSGYPTLENYGSFVASTNGNLVANRQPLVLFQLTNFFLCLEVRGHGHRASGYKIVITRAQGMYGIYCTEARGREASLTFFLVWKFVAMVTVSREIIVITRALGMHGIYCSQPLGRFAPSCFGAINAIHPSRPCYNYYLYYG